MINKNEKACIIINASSLEKYPSLIRTLNDYIAGKKLRWEIFVSNEANYNHLVGDCVKDGFKLFIIAGGDGALSHSINSLVGVDCYIGILPIGTGNDFSRHLDTPTETFEALESIRLGSEYLADVGKVDEHHFVNVAGAGFDADVLFNLSKFKSKNLPGSISYLLATVYSAIKLPSYQCDLHGIDRDGNKFSVSEKILLVSFGNGNYIGGGMMVAPFASSSDGFLDLIFIRKMSRLKFFSLLPSVFSGKHVSEKNMDKIEYIQFTELNVKFNREINFQLDGETYSGNELNVSIANEKIRIITSSNVFKPEAMPSYLENTVG